MAFDNMYRITAEDPGDPASGRVVWVPLKSLGILAMYAATAAGMVFWFRLDTVLLCVVKSLAVLLLGHSVGMHRRLIHKSFSCPKWLEYGLVYMGCLVGLGGPSSLIRTHDLRDWAQRQPRCHDYFAHRQPPLIDYLWQVHGALKLDRPPALRIEDEVANDPLYRLMENPVLVHLPWAIAFYLIGGWAWVVWGVCAPVAATATGHWLIGWFAHQPHEDDWQVRGAGVQGKNVSFFTRSSAAQAPRISSGGPSPLPTQSKSVDWIGNLISWLTMGESWHNNHHAFPGSARLGLYDGQSDPGYRFIKMLEALGLASDIRLPHDLPQRPQLQWSGDDPRPLMKPDLRLCPTLTAIRRLGGHRS